MKFSRLLHTVTLSTAVLVSTALLNPVFASWQPSGPITLMIGFKAGGGADTQGRLVAEELAARQGWKVIPEQVTGKAGLNLLAKLTKAPNDGTVIAMVVAETLGYNLAAAPRAKMQLDDFTPIVTTSSFQTGIVALPKNGWNDMNDVFEAMKSGKKIRFGSMSPKLSDLAYLVGKANGVEFNIVNVKGGKGVVNGVNAGDLDIGWAAGVQSKAVAAGDMVNLASGLSEPLEMSPDAPTITDLGVEFDAHGYFMFIAPKGIPDEARQLLADSIAEIVTDKSTKAGGMIEKAFGGADVIKGDELDSYLKNKHETAQKMIEAASE